MKRILLGVRTYNFMNQFYEKMKYKYVPRDIRRKDKIHVHIVDPFNK